MRSAKFQGILLLILVATGCSAAGADTWVDNEALVAIEAAFSPSELEQLQAAAGPLDISNDEADRKLTAVRIDPDDPIKGPVDAPVTIVVFTDFQCPFCSRHAETLDKIREKYGDRVRLVFKQFPLAFHREAHPAARASLAAARQGRFWEMHDMLFANFRSLSRGNYFTWATELGLDPGKFEEALDAKDIAAQVERDMKAGTGYEVRGTPSTFVNGVKVVGAQPFGKVEDAVLLGLGRAYVLLRMGVPADEVYDTLAGIVPFEGRATQGSENPARPGFLHEDWKN